MAVSYNAALGCRTSLGVFSSAEKLKPIAQAINLTYAASASSGVLIADSDQIDYGTGNFTISFTGSLPDWKAGSILVNKLASNLGYKLETVATSGFLKLTLNTTAYTSTDTPNLVAGTEHQITAVVTVGAVNTTVDFYVDGVQLGAQRTAANPGTVATTGNLYLLGTSAIRTAGTISGYAGYNRALTAAEALDFFRNGVNYADKWGNQTSIITGNDSTFAGASNWTNVDIDAYDETTGGKLTITADAADQYCRLPVANATTVAGKKYRLVYTSATLTKTWTIKDYGGTQTIGTIDVAGTVAIEFVAATTGGLMLVADDATSSVVLDNFLLYEIGATIALQPEGIGATAWADSSANALNASYPAAGASLTRLVTEAGAPVPASVAMTTTPASGSCDVQLVFKDAAGNAMNHKVAGLLYFSTDDGTAIAAATSNAVLTNGEILELVAGKADLFVTSAAGLLGFTVTGAAGSYYVSLVLPNGTVLTTGAIVSNA